MKHCHSKRYIGIDPGKSGGIAVIMEDGTSKSYKCPQTVQDMALVFSIAMGNTPPVDVSVAIEKVWAHPGDARSRAFVFGVNYGQWQGIIANYEIDFSEIPPQRWMKYYGLPKLEKGKRKNWLKDKAKELFPDHKKITLYIADALLIANYQKQSTKTS